jgi:hypothetical protein
MFTPKKYPQQYFVITLRYEDDYNYYPRNHNDVIHLKTDSMDRAVKLARIAEKTLRRRRSISIKNYRTQFSPFDQCFEMRLVLIRRLNVQERIFTNEECILEKFVE